MYEAFKTSGDGGNPIGQFCYAWEGIAREHGLTVHDERGDLVPELDDAITGLITAAIWFGINTGYLTLITTYRIPRKFLNHCPD